MIHKICNGEESKYLWIFFHAMNKLWYITGDEGCDQVSSKLCVWFQRRKQIYILGGNPHLNPLDPDFSNVMNKVWYIMGDEDCGEVSSELCV